MAPTRYPPGRPNPNWRQPDYARDGEVIWAAYHKRQAKLLRYTQTPEALKRRAEMEREFDTMSPIPAPAILIDLHEIL